MSVVNDTNKDHVLSYEGLEDVVSKIKNTFVRNTKHASDVELGLIKALDNPNVQLNELQDHDPDGNNYPVQIISDGTAFVNMSKPEIKTIDEDMIDIAWDEVIGIEAATIGVNYINNSKLT